MLSFLGTSLAIFGDLLGNLAFGTQMFRMSHILISMHILNIHIWSYFKDGNDENSRMQNCLSPFPANKRGHAEIPRLCLAGEAGTQTRMTNNVPDHEDHHDA